MRIIPGAPDNDGGNIVAGEVWRERDTVSVRFWKTMIR